MRVATVHSDHLEPSSATMAQVVQKKNTFLTFIEDTELPARKTRSRSCDVCNVGELTQSLLPRTPEQLQIDRLNSLLEGSFKEHLLLRSSGYSTSTNASEFSSDGLSPAASCDFSSEYSTPTLTTDVGGCASPVSAVVSFEQGATAEASSGSRDKALRWSAMEDGLSDDCQISRSEHRCEEEEEALRWSATVGTSQAIFCGTSQLSAQQGHRTTRQSSYRAQQRKRRREKNALADREHVAHPNYRHAEVPKHIDMAEEFSRLAVNAPPTTLMIRNVPNRYSQGELVAELELLGFSKAFDFLYIPLDKGSQANVGYAFINFLTPELAEKCIEVFEGYCFEKHRHNPKKMATVSIAHLQGLAANIQHYERTVVNNARAKQRRPIIMDNLLVAMGSTVG